MLLACYVFRSPALVPSIFNNDTVSSAPWHERASSTTDGRLESRMETKLKVQLNFGPLIEWNREDAEIAVDLMTGV
jgi:hypothetical protein